MRHVVLLANQTFNVEALSSQLQTHECSFHEMKSQEELAQLSKDIYVSVLVIRAKNEGQLKEALHCIPGASVILLYGEEDTGLLKKAYTLEVDDFVFLGEGKWFNGLLANRIEGNIKRRITQKISRVVNYLLVEFPYPIIVTRNERNRSGKVIFSNVAYNKLTGQDVSDLIGKETDLFETYGLKKRYKPSSQIFFRPDYQFQQKSVSRYFDILGYKVSDPDNDRIEFQVCFLIEVSNRVKAHYKIVRERDKTLEEVKAQERFLANIAHDIRKPLNNITGLVELIRDTQISSNQERIVGAMEQASSNLLTLINDLLDWARLEAGKFNLVEEFFEIRKFIDQMQLSFEQEANSKNIELSCTIDDDIPAQIKGDDDRLNQILTNLIGNALKFTKNGFVKLEVKRLNLSEENIMLRFSVKDSGIGIEPDKMKKIFNIFEQADGKVKRKFGGTGLGLAICKRLSELMGGKIFAESELDKGSVFSVDIPFKLDALSLSKKEEAERDEIVQDLKGIKVLLVDDNEVNRVVIKGLLNKWNALVEEAESGQASVDLASVNDFDLVLMDVQMPGMNGFEAAEAIKTNYDARDLDVPVLALSAYLLSENDARLKSNWVDDFLLKPINPDILYERIEGLLDRKPRVSSQASKKDVTRKTESGKYKIIDEDHIRKFANGDDEFMRQMIQIFLKRTPEYMDDLYSAVQENDWEMIKRMAHKVKPTFTYVGMQRFTERVGEIEYHAGERNLSAIKNIMNEVWDDTQLAFREFDHFLNNF